MEDQQGYSPIFYVMLIVGFIGLIGLLCTSGAMVGGM